MDVNTIYDTIFPIGGIDDNNRYCDLKGDQITSVQLVEPTLAVNEFVLDEKYTYDKNNLPYKYAYRIPMIALDEYTINPVDICAFKLDYTEFIPSLMFEFVDTSNSVLSTNVTKDGTIIKIYIGGQGDELYYKPIRQDFVLTSIRKIAGGNQNYGEFFKYRVYGKLNVPYGYRKESWCGGKCSAMQTLFNVAIWTGLGFATNFTKNNTLDVMKWTNNATGTYFDFMEDVTAHACYSPNTFFTSFIDQYNVLNFVECHSLLSHGGKKSDVPAMMYKCYPPQTLPPYKIGEEKTTENQLPLKTGDDPLNNVYQRLSYYFLSNNDHFDGWSNFIEEYQEISNGNSSLSDGLKTHVIYSDSNEEPWKFNVCDFTIRPIDNLKRDSSSQHILPINEYPDQTSYIPLNLMQITRKEYLGEQASVDNMSNVESFHNFGNIDTSNTFKQYFFAEVQNSFQMKCLKKCGLRVKLQNYNPAVTKFSRVWVDIYDKNLMSNTAIAPSDIRENEKGTAYNKYKLIKNENILKFNDEGVIDDIEDKDRKNKNWPRGEYNRSLSGWYVVTSIEIEYNPKENNLNMILILNRIEYQPCFKDEYEIAKKAIDKYKDENLIENLLVPYKETIN
jgi:signal peptidase I